MGVPIYKLPLHTHEQNYIDVANTPMFFSNQLTYLPKVGIQNNTSQEYIFLRENMKANKNRN